MEGNSSEKLLEEVIAALIDAGYDPYDQLESYIQTGDASVHYAHRRRER